MNRKTYASPLIMILFLGGSIVLAEQKGWLDRLLPSKNPQVLTQPSKPLVEPPAAVLNLQNSFAQVSDAVKPAVVNISAVHIEKVEQSPEEFYFGDPNEFFYRFFGGQEPPQQQQQQRPRKPRELRSEGTGSGVIIDPEGYILTNNHVVQGADQLTVTMSDGKMLKGSVVGTDPRTDIAVIRVKAGHKLPFAPLADSSGTRIGDWVLAIGSPFGLEQTVTAGIISAIRQSLVIEGRQFKNLLQTDAAINRGNSGGPLVDIRGQVVGINTAIYAPTGVYSGIGFAIPINEAKSILQDLIKRGYVERSWLGVEIGEMDEVMAQQFGLKEKGGAIVNSVMPNSPAEKAGLQRGDVVLEINGKKMKNVIEVQDTVSTAPPKTTLQLTVMRDGARKTLSVVTEKMPNQERAEKNQPASVKEDGAGTIEWLDAMFTGLNPNVREQYGIDAGVKGVVAVTVPEDSEAAQAGLDEGDVIRAINQQRITDVASFKNVIKNVNPKKGLVFDVVRRGRSFYFSYKALE
jgi:serine protease Do